MPPIEKGILKRTHNLDKAPCHVGVSSLRGALVGLFFWNSEDTNQLWALEHSDAGTFPTGDPDPPDADLV